LNDDTYSRKINSAVCDLCGKREVDFILATTRLDGPLVRCRNCDLYFAVIPEKEMTADKSVAESDVVKAAMARLAVRAKELELVEPQVERNEQPWRELMARERLDDLKRFICGGRLLEIGCATGEFLAAAQSSFDVFGVEADAENSRLAAGRGLRYFNGALRDARFPEEHFDVAAIYHVIEHFPSPIAEMRELHRVIKPGGWLAIETPNIANMWYRLLGARWRQFIPDHLYFFSPQTMARLCRETGFEIRELRNAGKAMSVRLLVSRLGRYHRPTARLIGSVSRTLNFDDHTLRLNFGDVMRLYAQRK